MDLLAPLATPQAGLAGLFALSFLAATLLPGGSEAALLALVLTHPDQTGPALLVATIGNTAGGVTTWAMGRALPATDPTSERTRRHIRWLQRWGPSALILAWAPIIGDALCAAAGWLRLPLLPCTLWMTLGKAARYAVLVAGAKAM